MKKKRMSRWVIPVVLLIAAAVSAGGFYFYKTEYSNMVKEQVPTPEDLFEQYTAYLQAGDFEGMYELLDQQSQQSITKEAFIERNQNIYGGMEADQFNLQVLEALEYEDQTASVSYEISFQTVAGEIRFANGMLMTKMEEEPYKIAWQHSLILPGLTSTDRVRVTSQRAERGEIYDRNGILLAGKGAASSVGLVPGKMSEDRTADLARLSELLKVSTESIENRLSAGWVKDDSFVPIKTLKKVDQLNLTSLQPSQANLDNQQLQEALLEIPGVMITDTPARVYPLGETAAHLVGYVQNVTAEDLELHKGEGYRADSVIGRSGMETLYEKELKGSDGVEIAIYSASDERKKVMAVVPKKDGETIRLTIDSVLQTQLYQQLKDDKSAAAAMDPYSGEVLALVSTPSYDNNDFVLGISTEQWDALNNNEAMPLYNRFRQRWSPGSSFKPITAAIALDLGVVTPEEDLGNAGLRWQQDPSWGNYFITTLHETNPANLQHATVLSDNIYFARLALRIGSQQLGEQLDRLGFGQKIPFEINMTESQYAGSEGIKSEVQLADSGYGQGEVLVNPLHLAGLYTGFLNHGTVIKPRLRSQDGAAAEVWIADAFQSEHADLIRDNLIETVRSSEGTGHRIYRPDITFAAKTGTAEIKQSQQDETGTELGWMAVFTADPEIANPLLLVTMVEDVKGRGGSGYVAEKMKYILNERYPESPAQ